MVNTQNQQTPAEESISKMEALVLKYKKALVSAVVAIVVIVVGCILINNFYLVPRQDEASTALAKSQDYFAQGDFDKALKGDGAGSIGLLKVIDEYSCTDAGNIAKLYAGLAYAQTGKWQEAVDQLESYSTGDDAMVSPASQAALGNAYAHLNKLDDAVKSLKKAASMADSKAENGRNVSLSPTYLIQAAEILESQGKKAEALEIYKDIKANYVNSVAYRDIDKYIERCSE